MAVLARCPAHFTIPVHNAEWWRTKIDRNRERDRNNQERAEADGWLVIESMEHENVLMAAARNRVCSPNPHSDPRLG